MTTEVRQVIKHKEQYIKYVLVPKEESLCDYCFFFNDIPGCADHCDLCDQELVLWKEAIEDDYVLAKLRGIAS